MHIPRATFEFLSTAVGKMLLEDLNKQLGQEIWKPRLRLPQCNFSVAHRDLVVDRLARQDAVDALFKSLVGIVRLFEDVIG